MGASYLGAFIASTEFPKHKSSGFKWLVQFVQTGNASLLHVMTSTDMHLNA